MSLLTLLGKSAFGMETTEEKLGRLLAEAQALAEQLQVGDDLEAGAALRNQLVETSKRLTRTLQTPIDRAWDVFFQPHHLAVLQTALDVGWLQFLSSAGEAGLSADQLAASTTPNADPSLVRRLMRVLTSTGTVTETGAEAYAATDFSALFCTPEWGTGLRHWRRDVSVPVAKMPDYFAEKGLQSPPSIENGLYPYSHGIPFLQYLGQNPAAAKEFNIFMAAVRAGKKPWTDSFPIAEKLDVDSADDVLLVDMGGGKGHDLASLSATQKHLGLKGKLILQDLPRALTQVPDEWKDSFEIQAHDFFTPQPAIHARAYYLRNILHGWSDEECVSILSHIRDAMKPGYSKLLINEIILPDAGCGFWGAAFDLSMMAVVNGRLRTERQWKELISKVECLGLKKIWKVGTDGESLLEADREG